MTIDELKKFEREWLHEAEIEVSQSLDRECRLGYGWDDMIYEQYRTILKDFLGEKEITPEEYDQLISNIHIKRPDDDHGEDQEKK